MINAEYDAIIFDNDGVLIEPTERKTLFDAVHRSFAEFDVEAADEDVWRAVRNDLLRFDEVRENHGIDPAEWWPRREAAAAAAQCEAIRSGSKALYDDVDALTELDHAMGVVSNNQHETIEFILDHHGLGEYFETYYGREPTVEGAQRKKPDSYYLELAMEDLGTTNALYVGDSEKDVVTAERAGVDCAFIRRPHRADLTLSAEPTYEFDDLRSLVDALVAERAASD